MSLTRPARTLRGWARNPHLPLRTVRMRLTLLYGALFLVSGAVLLAITYGLAWNATTPQAGRPMARGQHRHHAETDAGRARAAAC